MIQCKDNTTCFSWRNTVCTPNKGVRVGVYQTVFGAAWKRFYQNIANLPWAGGRDWNCGKSPTEFPTFCVQVANGKPRHMSSVPAVHCIATSRNGHRRGVFRQLWKYCLRHYDHLRGIQWKWQSLDGSTTKAPLGGEKNREKPADRGKLGIKRSVLDRWPGRALGRGHCRRKCARPKTFSRHARQSPYPSSPSHFSPPSTSVLRQGI